MLQRPHLHPGTGGLDVQLCSVHGCGCHAPARSTIQAAAAMSPPRHHTRLRLCSRLHQHKRLRMVHPPPPKSHSPHHRSTEQPGPAPLQLQLLLAPMQALLATSLHTAMPLQHSIPTSAPCCTPTLASAQADQTWQCEVGTPLTAGLCAACTARHAHAAERRAHVHPPTTPCQLSTAATLAHAANLCAHLGLCHAFLCLC